MKSIRSKIFWDAVGCKLIEQFVSVKLWVITFASIFAWKILNIVIEIKDVTLYLVNNNLSTETIISLLTQWSGKLLDVTLTFFTAVIVIILLSREVFKHKVIEVNHEDNTSKIKSEIV